MGTFNPLAEWPALSIPEHPQVMARKPATYATTSPRGNSSLIQTFNQTVPIEWVLEEAGYDRNPSNPKQWRHPASESGSYSASVKDGRIHSMSTNDPLYTGGGGSGAHDSFSALQVLLAQGDMRQALNIASQLLPDSNVDVMPDGINHQKRGLMFRTVAELLADRSPPAWIVRGLLEENSLALLIGAPASGKSLLAIDLAVSIVLGRPWQENKTVQGPVVILAGEGHAGFKRRLRAWEVSHEASIGNAPLVVSNRAVALTNAQSIDELCDAIHTSMQGFGNPKLIIVDTLHRNMGDGDENSASDMGAFIAALDRLRDEFSCSVLIVHHTGHSDSTRARGSSSLRAAVDTEWLLTVEAGERRILRCAKAKEAEPFAPMWFAVDSVALDWLDECGAPQQSAILRSVAPQPRTATSRRLGRGESIAMKALLDVIGANGTPPSQALQNEFPFDEFPKVVREEMWRERCFEADISKSTKLDAKRKAFQRAKDGLLKTQNIRIFGEYVWPTDSTNATAIEEGLKPP